MPYSKSNVADPGRGKSLTGFEYCHQTSSTSNEVPTAAELKTGELAINTADGKIFYKKANGTIGAVPGGATISMVVYDDDSAANRTLVFQNGILVSANIT